MRKALLILVLLSGYCNLLSAQSQSGMDVRSVAIEGTERIDVQAVETVLTAKPGMVSSQTVRRDVRSLFSSGFFSDVQARVVPSNLGDTLVYYVKEKPTLRKLFIKGNEELSESELREVLDFGESRFVDTVTLNRVAQAAKTRYQSEGYNDATVSWERKGVSENQVDVTFSVSEGKRYRIETIKFVGLEKIDPDDLEEVIQTSTYSRWTSWLLGSGRLDPEMLKNDRLLLRQYLVDHGYIDGVVREAVVEEVEGDLQIVFEVKEGAQYRFGSLRAAGDLVEGSIPKTLEDTTAESGDVFSGSILREDAIAISENFGDIGYAFANVVPNTKVNREQSTVDVTYESEKGDLVSINRIKISGNTKTYDKVIRRELRLQEQDTYSTSKLNRSKILLERLGYFEEVGIVTEPAAAPDEVNLLVNVREGSTGTFSVGAGFSTADGVLFNARLSENNFLGTGRQLTLNADVGTVRENIVLSMSDRRLFDTYWSAGVNVLRTERRFLDFDRLLQGGGMSVGYPLEELTSRKWLQDIQFSVRYEYLDIEIKDVDPNDAAQFVIDSEGTSTASGLTPSLVRNTINNPLNPTSGSRQELSFEVTGFGGSEEYYLFEASNTLYHPIVDTSWGAIVFSMRNNFGYGETFDDDPFPLFKRYFPGGINSVRGFKIRTLGPVDENGNEFGGSKQLVNNFEIIFPLLGSAGLNGVVFYDIGQAFDDEASIEFSELREAYGFGIRWISPMGPIRLEFGIPLDREEDEDSFVTLFSFGAPL